MDELTVQCPYCFELVSLDVEHDVAGQFVQDCEVCCRPWSVRVQRESGGEPVVTIDRAQ